MTDEVVIDLEYESWKALKAAASESKWIPHEHYYVNDWVADCCEFLREGYQAGESNDNK